MNTLKKYYITYIWMGVMFYLLFSPSGSLPKTGLINIPHIDKIVHFGMFGVFACAYLFDSENANNARKKAILWILVISIFFGISSELIQYSLIPGREGSVYDFFADFVGIISGIVFYYAIGRKVISKYLQAKTR